MPELPSARRSAPVAVERQGGAPEAGAPPRRAPPLGTLASLLAFDGAALLFAYREARSEEHTAEHQSQIDMSDALVCV